MDHLEAGEDSKEEQPQLGRKKFVIGLLGAEFVVVLTVVLLLVFFHGGSSETLNQNGDNQQPAIKQSISNDYALNLFPNKPSLPWTGAVVHRERHLSGS